MYNIGVMGDKDSVMGFAALGLSVRYCETAEETKAALRDMADFGIVYITERLFSALSEEQTALQNRLTPAVIPIPDNRGRTGLGMERVRDRIERAVGADIIGE